ncbi:MAG: BLUF domain-containing protein [Alphaproteobacteria bacterium]
MRQFPVCQHSLVRTHRQRYALSGKRSRANNALLGITGLLLHIDGGFLQMLEGEERSVRELYAHRGGPPAMPIRASCWTAKFCPRLCRLEHVF